MSMENIEVSRVMMPDDANIAGNVHGGTILKMIEEAGVIIATRHCNQGNEGKSESALCLAALARVETTDFLQPMFIGEVAKVHAELSYASKHSLEVTACVWAENLRTGVKRLTNQAYLWYVAVTMEPAPGLGMVPAITDLTEDQLGEGEKRYLKQKQARAHRKMNDDSNDLYNLRPQNMLTVGGNEQVPLHSVPYSQSTLISMVNPSDCNQFGYGQGGPVMKSMDTVAGIVAFRHCRTNVVTVSLESLDFRAPVKLGHVMTFTGRIVFTSNRSMEIEVLVDAEDVVNGKCFRCVSALFTYVSLDEKKNVQKVPKLEVRSKDEERRFTEGKLRYEIKKEERAKMTKKPKMDVSS